MGVETTLFDLTGRVALLTGASKGMGLHMAEGLAEHGARVVVSSRKIEQCEAAVAQINDQCGDGSAIAIACNIGYKDQLEALVGETRSRLGPIDILIANAGQSLLRPDVRDSGLGLRQDHEHQRALQPLAVSDGCAGHGREGQGQHDDHRVYRRVSLGLRISAPTASRSSRTSPWCAISRSNTAPRACA